MDRKTLLLLFLVVFVPSLLIRLHPTTSESFQYDAVISQMAAREGIVANAWDASGTYAMRRQHPPLLSYVIELNNRGFGDDPFRARIFSILFGSLTCLAVSIGIAALAPPSRIRLPAAVFGGWLVCLLPVHLYVSRTSNWDTVYGFFAVGSLVCMGRYLARESTRLLCAAALFATLAFLTCELGLFLLPAAGVLLLRDTTRLPAARVAARWAGMVLFMLVVIALLWPAGIFKLDLGRTLVFRWHDSWAAERNLPWYGFYTELFRQ
ncbi:MAG TPA: glycosyltransferase family 39 protein, partial [Candidatus Krumholzibacteria bacterium]